MYVPGSIPTASSGPGRPDLADDVRRCDDLPSILPSLGFHQPAPPPIPPDDAIHTYMPEEQHLPIFHGIEPIASHDGQQ